MKTQHTPGPWVVCGASVCKGSRRHPICDTYMWASNSSGLGPEITKANARLIAAAPGLLAALADSADALDAICAGILDLDKAKNALRSINERNRAVIAKALGHSGPKNPATGSQGTGKGIVAEQHGA